jgi:hypothetical protein
MSRAGKPMRRAFEVAGPEQVKTYEKTRENLENKDIRNVIRSNFDHIGYGDIIDKMTEDKRIKYINSDFFKITHDYYKINGNMRKEEITKFLKKHPSFLSIQKDFKGDKPLFMARSIATVIRYMKMIQGYH